MSEYHKDIDQSTDLSDQFLDLREVLQEGLLSFCTAAGVTTLYAVMAEDVVNVVGVKGKHSPDRKAYRHGFEITIITIAGANTPILRPRVRTIDGKQVNIESYELARRGDLLCVVALNRMLHGLSSRNYNYGSENPGSKGSVKSTVSRRFIRATEAELKKLMKRQVPEVVVLYIDGVVYAEHNVIVAMYGSGC